MEELSRKDYETGFKRLLLVTRDREHAADDTDIRNPKRYMEMNVCAICGHTWKSRTGGSVPASCPNCRSSLWNVKGLFHHTCSLCGHTWVSRMESPTRCPGCKSKSWREWTNHYVCDDCGYFLDVPQSLNVLDRCPQCSSPNWGCDYIRCTCKHCGYSGFYKADRPGRCPSCKTTVYNGPSDIDRKNTETDDGRMEIDRNVLAVLQGYDGSNSSDVINRLLNMGMNFEEAQVIIRYIDGDNEVNIAREMDLAYGAVRTIVNDLNSNGVTRSVR